VPRGVRWALAGEEPTVVHVLMWTLAVLITGIAVVESVRLRAAAPAVALTRAGVQVKSLLGEWFAPWDALLAPPPRQPFDLMLDHLDVREPGPVRYRGLRLRRRRVGLPLYELRTVHPWFVYDAIAYYVGHPEHRDAIGEESEHERLRHTLGAIEGATAR